MACIQSNAAAYSGMNRAENLAMARKTSALHGINLDEPLMGCAGAAIKSGVSSVLHALDDGASGRCVLVNGQKVNFYALNR
jgi:hypothetical protein